MDNQRLRELLTQLRAELDQTETMDAASRAQLEALVHDAQEALERSEEHDQHVNDRFVDAVQHFEASYPRLTVILSQVTDVLRRTF